MTKPQYLFVALCLIPNPPDSKFDRSSNCLKLLPAVTLEPLTPSHSAGGMALVPPSPADNVGILAAEVYFPNTYVSGCVAVPVPLEIY